MKKNKIILIILLTTIIFNYNNTVNAAMNCYYVEDPNNLEGVKIKASANIDYDCLTLDAPLIVMGYGSKCGNVDNIAPFDLLASPIPKIGTVTAIYDNEPVTGQIPYIEGSDLFGHKSVARVPEYLTNMSSSDVYYAFRSPNIVPMVPIEGYGGETCPDLLTVVRIYKQGTGLWSLEHEDFVHGYIGMKDQLEAIKKAKFKSSYSLLSFEYYVVPVTYEYTVNSAVILRNVSETDYRQAGKIKPAESTPDASSSSLVETLTCDKLISDDMKGIMDHIMLYFRIIAPIIIIGFSTYEFVKAMPSKEEEMKKATTRFAKRLGIGLLLFMSPILINIIFKIANTVWASKGLATCTIDGRTIGGNTNTGINKSTPVSKCYACGNSMGATYYWGSPLIYAKSQNCVADKNYTTEEECLKNNESKCYMCENSQGKLYYWQKSQPYRNGEECIAKTDYKNEIECLSQNVSPPNSEYVITFTCGDEMPESDCGLPDGEKTYVVRSASGEYTLPDWSALNTVYSSEDERTHYSFRGWSIQLSEAIVLPDTYCPENSTIPGCKHSFKMIYNPSKNGGTATLTAKWTAHTGSGKDF